MVVKFTVGNGNRPDLGEVEFAVELAVGCGKRPDLGSVEFAVKFAVEEGMKPDLGMVGFRVKFKLGMGRPETEPVVYAEALALGKMPAETEKTGIVLMFKVGKGRVPAETEKIATVLMFKVVEADELAKFVGVWLTDSGNPKVVVDMLELGALWLATVKGSWETVVVSVVVPLAIVVVPRIS